MVHLRRDLESHAEQPGPGRNYLNLGFNVLFPRMLTPHNMGLTASSLVCCDGVALALYAISLDRTALPQNDRNSDTDFLDSHGLAWRGWWSRTIAVLQIFCITCGIGRIQLPRKRWH